MSLIITRSQTVYRRVQPGGAKVGRTVQFYIPRFFIPVGHPEKWGRIVKPAIVERVERGIATLRVLIDHDVVTPGRW